MADAATQKTKGAASAAPAVLRAPRFEVRAVWIHPDKSMSSQSVSHFDRQAMYDRPPNLFGVYQLYGGVVEDHIERAAAETHCAQLNGGAND